MGPDGKKEPDDLIESESEESRSNRSDLSHESEVLLSLPDGQHLGDLEPGSFFGHLCLEKKNNKNKEVSAFA